MNALIQQDKSLRDERNPMTKSQPPEYNKTSIESSQSHGANMSDARWVIAWRVVLFVMIVLLGSTLCSIVGIYPASFPVWLKGRLEIIELALKVAAGVIGGTWAIQHFTLNRPDEWSVNLSTETKQHLLDDERCMLIVSVTIENVSAVRIFLNSFETQVCEIGNTALKSLEFGQSDPINFETKVDENNDIALKSEESEKPCSSKDKPGVPKTAYLPVKVIKHHSDDLPYLIEPNSKYVEEFAVIVKTTSVIRLFTEVKKDKDGLPINQRRFVVIKQKKISSCKSQGGVTADDAPPA